MEHKNIVAVDFDFTISQTDPIDHRTILGEIPDAFRTLKDLREAGYVVILWTCRSEDYLEEALLFCAENGFVFDAVNENWEGLDFPTSNKIYYDYLIDDHNFGTKGKVDWGMVRSQLLFEGDEEILWKGDFISVISPRDNPYEAVAQQDSVMCILHDVVTGAFFVRQELCPPYNHRTGRPYWYTLVSGGIEAGEKPVDALIREVAEEAGVLLRESIDVSMRCLFSGPLNKTLSNFGHFFFVEGQFLRVSPTTDGTVYEAKSRTLELSYDELLGMSREHADFLLISAISLIRPFVEKA